MFDMKNYMRVYRKKNKLYLLRQEVHRLFMLYKKLNKHKETEIRQNKWKNIQTKSNKFVVRKLNCNYNGKIHQIHHCFGADVYSFVIMLKEDHIELHKIFGIKNEDCSFSNPNVKNFILNKPHILIKDKEIIENTLNVNNCLQN